MIPGMLSVALLTMLVVAPLPRLNARGCCG